ncbi:MAG: hypothetical protein M1338_05130, partial [Patescibacteria group bacterium]|nr:hypothetical protein [Patescibacteria group bacterium]
MKNGIAFKKAYHFNIKIIKFDLLLFIPILYTQKFFNAIFYYGIHKGIVKKKHDPTPSFDTAPTVP